MATYSFYPEFGRSLTCLGPDAKAGEKRTLSISSFAYGLPMGRFGYQGSQWTDYVLPEPVGHDDRGQPLFDLEGLGQCPLDGSFQNEETRLAARKSWLTAGMMQS